MTKKTIKNMVFFLTVAALSILLVSCKNDKVDYKELYGENYYEENTKANQEYLFGMGHIGWSNYDWEGIDYKISTQLMNNMGVKSVRNWMHSNWLMNDPTTYNEKGLALMRSIVDDLTKYDFQLIGMNHSNFHASGYENSGSTTAKPARDLTEGSMYLKWLDDYETTWYNIVIQFPEITYWEIDNEPNNDVFFPRLEGGVFTLRQKAQIYTDMMYYASKGIHRANPEAVTIMGGLIPSTAAGFLEYVYEEIFDENSRSQYPDDYFQIASWHPYMNNFTKEDFVSFNNGVYDVVKKNEGKDKKVFLTETGWSEVSIGINKITQYIEEMYAATKEALPYVESIHYFIMYDHLASSWGSPAERKFGLFMDPNEIDGTVEGYIKGGPKISALKYQEIASGVGSLNLHVDKNEK